MGSGETGAEDQGRRDAGEEQGAEEEGVGEVLDGYFDCNEGYFAASVVPC